MVNDSSNNKSIFGRSSQYFEAAILSCVVSGSTLGLYFGFNRYIRQISTATEIPAGIFRKRWLYGKVTAVGDGDNFHFFHTPGGKLCGWGWLRNVPQNPVNNSPNKERFISVDKKSRTYKRRLLDWFFNNNQYTSKSIMNLHIRYKNLRNLPTIPIRIYAVDAPERAHFGGVTQPFGDEALVWLSYKLIGKYVWIKPLSVDQYNRCVAKVVYWDWFRWKNISLEMVQVGLAVVYEGKSTAQFDGEEYKFRFYESRAKAKKRGLWIQNRVITPGEYKKKNK